MSHRYLQEDIGLELPFAVNMIAELLERIDDSDRSTIAMRIQLDPITWGMTTNSHRVVGSNWFKARATYPISQSNFSDASLAAAPLTAKLRKRC